MAILFKSPELKKQFKKAHHSVKLVVRRLAKVTKEDIGKDIVVTSVYRPLATKSVHGQSPCSGVDVRVNGKYDFKKREVRRGDYSETTTPNITEAQRITEKVNAQVIYDSSRPEKKSVVFGKMDKKNNHWNHWHCQGKNKTRYAMSQCLPIDLELDIPGPEDYIKAEGLQSIDSNFSITEKLWHKVKTNAALMTGVRRAGKTISAITGFWLLTKLGVSNEVALTAIPVLMASEKAANVKLEQRTGTPQNLDWVSLLFKLITWLGNLLKKKKEVK